MNGHLSGPCKMGPGTGLAGWTGKTEVAFDSVMTTELKKTHVKHPFHAVGLPKAPEKRLLVWHNS